MIGPQKYLVLLAITAAAATACSNSTAFVDGKAGNVVKGSSDREADSEETNDYFVDELSAVIVAQQPTSLKLTKSAAAKLKIEFTLAPEDVLAKGLRFNSESGELEVTSDLEHIGASFKGKLTIIAGEVNEEIAYDIQIVAPAVDKKECFEAPPVIGAIAPVQKWHWAGVATPEGMMRTTYSAPVAADLDNDGTVEVVSIPSLRSVYGNVIGPIMVLNGKTGDVLWNSYSLSTTEKIGGLVSTTPALVDLDGDGFVEIIAATNFVSATSATAKQVNIYDYKTKTLKKTFNQSFACHTICVPAVADIDGDSKAEIIIGNVILDNLGNLKVSLVHHTGVAGNTPAVGELNASHPGLEIVQGGVIYSSTGAKIASVKQGYYAIADLEKDGQAELIVVTEGKVFRYNGSGVLTWQALIPLTPDAKLFDAGGAPNVGDFDGDGDFEIGTAGAYYYAVFQHNGDLLWQSRTQDESSRRTGSTLFDFNGDGKVEVVYNDELKLRIYNGADGQILWETSNASGTLYEYPIILNVDDDPSVEIVVSAPDMGGVRVFEDPTNLWVGSRRLWNQYSYFPELIGDDLKVLANPAVSKEGFRVNVKGVAPLRDRVSLPDLAVQVPFGYDQNKQDEKNVLSFFVRNQGEAALPSGAVVSLHGKDSDEEVGHISLDAALGAGTGQTIKIVDGAPEKKFSEYRVKLNLDATSQRPLNKECVEANNKAEFKIVP